MTSYNCLRNDQPHWGLAVIKCSDSDLLLNNVLGFYNLTYTQSLGSLVAICKLNLREKQNNYN